LTSVSISPASPDDLQAMAALLAEMDRFYGSASADPPDERLRQINEALFADPPAAHALLAWDGAELVGFAAYSFLWPAIGLTRSLYLKELYVAARSQRQGVGKRLMEALFEVGAKHRCSRVEWTTDTDNVGAQAFYEMVGLPPHPTKIFYRVEDTGQGFQFPPR
jgi:GNAT superfamily N-acetyltransferase